MDRETELARNKTGIICVLLDPALEQDRTCKKVLDEFKNKIKCINVINRDNMNPCLLELETQRWLTLAYVIPDWRVA